MGALKPEDDGGIMVPVAEFAPDLPTNNAKAASSNLINLYPRTKESYGPVFSIAEYSSSALTSTPLGAIAAPDSAGNNYVVAGDTTSLYVLPSGATAFTTLSSAFAVAVGEAWSFTQYGQKVIAVAAGQTPQAYTLGGALAALGGTPPKARYCAVIKDWLMMANTSDATNGDQPQRVQWCAIGDPTTWPAAGSVSEAQLLAGSQVIPGPQGWLTGIVGNLGNADGALFFERAVWRVVYAGSPLVFGFYPAEGVRGCRAPRSIAQNGALVYYLGEDGFYVFDGSTSQPIGVDRVDSTFWRTVNTGFLFNVISAVDPINRLVVWIYPSVSSSDGTPDSMLVYNWAIDRWGFAQQTIPYIFRSVTQGYSLEGLDAVSTNLDALPYSLDSRQWTGGTMTMGTFSTNKKLAFFTGTALAAIADTVEIEPFADQGRQAWIDAVRPLVDADCTVQIGHRSRLKDSPTLSSAASIDSDGLAPFRIDNRYIRGRINIAAGSSFQHVQGMRLFASPSGKR